MALMLPEGIVIATAFAVLLADLFVTDGQRRHLVALAAVGLSAALLALVVVVPDVGTAFGGRFAVDPLAWWFKLVFLVGALGTVAMLPGEFSARAGRLPQLSNLGEFLTLLLLNLAGMLFVASARDVVLLYVALELATIPLFLLAAWRRDAAGVQAGMQYLVIGALASALLLYGLGLLYGLTGTLDLLAMGKLLPATPAAWFAAALVFAGMGFKLTLVPFHFWAAEVYQGAPAPVVAWLSVASKAAGLTVLLQLLYRVFGPHVAGWGQPIALLAAATMSLGNLAAIGQNNIKRFMAFSAISQAGYLLLGLLDTGPGGTAALLFYLVVYAATNLAAFAVIVTLQQETGGEQIGDFRGLSRRSPLLALAMMLALFGLAGIPPLAGFTGKFFLFSAAAHAGMNWLVGVAAVNSTISLYYYLRIVRQMYIEPADAGAEPVTVPPAMAVALWTTTAAAMVMGVVPYFYQAVADSASVYVALLAR